MIKNTLYIVPCFAFAHFYSQQKILGRVADENNNALASVLIYNISNNTKTQSDSSGQFVIEAKENEEIRFLKQDYYRVDKKINKENINLPLDIKLLKIETLILEVEIPYKPTGNLEKDSKHYDQTRKTLVLKSEMDAYMRSPLKEPLPENKIPKTFSGHDFNAGQVDMVKLFLTGIGLVKKASQPKVTKPDYYETQNFINRLKLEINLDFLVEKGMNEEQIDEFLVYANDKRYLAKKYRKTFNKSVIVSELRIAFIEYDKTHVIKN